MTKGASSPADDYDPQKDGIGSYYAAIEAKRLRGDAHYPERSAVVTLPWPDRELSPNSRVHWGRKAKAVKEARSVAAWTATADRRIERLKGAAMLQVSVSFSPPDGRARDLDNMLASIKPYLDGIADVIGVDDSRWSIALRRGEPKKGGEVKIQIEVCR